MKVTVCATCGSQDLERLGWVSLQTRQFVGDFADTDDVGHLDTYCNKCGERQPTVEREYAVSEKYGSAYRLAASSCEGYMPYIIVAPMFKAGGIDTESECEVDLDNAFNDVELQEFYVEMKKVFIPDDLQFIEAIFKPHLKQFAGVWFAPVYPPTANLLTMDEINENKGYSKEDIDKVSKLELAEFVWLGEHPFTDKSHLVTRVS